MVSEEYQSVPTVSFEGIQDGDEPEVMELIHASFDESWPGLPLTGEPVDYLRWKIRSPLIDSSYSTVMKADGRIIGLGVQVAREACLRGRKYLISAGGGDTCVHPDYQGQGLYRALATETNERSLQRFAFAVGNSTNPTVLRSRRSRGVHSIIHPFDRMLKPVDPNWKPGGDDTILRRTARSVRFRARQLYSRLRWRSYRNAVSVELRQVDSFDERMDHFSDAVAASFDLILNHDAAFLNWRYCDQRAGDFRTTIAEADGEVLGFSALRLRRDGCYFADLLALPDRLDVVRALIEDAIQFAGRAGAPVLGCVLPRHHPYTEVFHRLRFVRAGADMTRAYWPWNLPDELEFLGSDDHSRIHLLEGDGDMI